MTRFFSIASAQNILAAAQFARDHLARIKWHRLISRRQRRITRCQHPPQRPVHLPLRFQPRHDFLPQITPLVERYGIRVQSRLLRQIPRPRVRRNRRHSRAYPRLLQCVSRSRFNSTRRQFLGK